MGIFLLLIVSGLAISALKNAEVAIGTLAHLKPQFASFCSGSQDSCILGPLVWDLTQILPDKKFPGLLLKSLFGYRDRLFITQAIVYFLFLTTAGSLYFQSLSTSSRQKTLKS
jgi:high-affinity iron transporter